MDAQQLKAAGYTRHGLKQKNRCRFDAWQWNFGEWRVTIDTLPIVASSGVTVEAYGRTLAVAERRAVAKLRNFLLRQSRRFARAAERL